MLLSLPHSYKIAPLAGKGGFYSYGYNPLDPDLLGMLFHSFLHIVSSHLEEDGVSYGKIQYREFEPRG